VWDIERVHPTRSVKVHICINIRTVRNYLRRIPPRAEDDARMIKCRHGSFSRFIYIPFLTHFPTNESDKNVIRPKTATPSSAMKIIHTRICNYIIVNPKVGSITIRTKLKKTPKIRWQTLNLNTLTLSIKLKPQIHSWNPSVINRRTFYTKSAISHTNPLLIITQL
jgi:hypothetical protein